MIDSYVTAATDMIREWAARTRPHLSDPPEGQEWRVVVHPLTPEDVNLETNEVNLRYEWVLVPVPSDS